MTLPHDGSEPPDEVEALQRRVDELSRRASSLERELAESERRRRQVERAAQRARTDLDRLRGRRIVRASLAMARLARPLFRWRRGQSITTPTTTGTSHHAAPRPPLDPTWFEPFPDPARTGEPVAVVPEDVRRPWPTSAFHDELDVVLRGGVTAAFRDEFAASEAELAGRSPATGHGTRVSIIMPTWNRAELITTAIASVLDQDHRDWELLVCDDGSTDDTAAVVRGLEDPRIRLLALDHAGAAAARNAGLAAASGDLIAYLDSDNLWHPAFLSTMVAALADHPGRHAAYARYIDVVEDADGVQLKTARALPFDYDRLATKNFVDLNGFVHRRSLPALLGGFDEGLVRQQDWDLVLKYSFLREPLYVDHYLVLYRRNAAWGQITDVHRENVETPRLIASKVDAYYREGLPAPDDDLLPSLTVVSWDVCRNHFSKAYNLAECIADPSRVQLLGFRFFDEPIFPPYADADPAFAMDVLDGGELPAWWATLARGVANVRGEVVYAVKPRLPSLGLALLRNHAFGTPIVVETNDLEGVVTRPRAGQELTTATLDEVDPADPDLRNPYGDRWTAILEELVPRLPLRVTHNHTLDDHFGGGAYFVRNLKDDRYFDPDRHDRDEVRREYGFAPGERIVLFGGMVRRHKGVFEILDAVRAAGPDHRLVVVGSRETPDQTRLREIGGRQLTILDPVDRNEMARLNLASDAVVLWLDLDVPASRFQMPYKLTDALAMQVPVVVDDVGDLGRLVRGGYARHAPFRDATALRRVLEELREDRDATATMTGRGRRLYLREFSYRGVRRELDVIRTEAMAHVGVLDVAGEFAEFVGRVRVAQGVGT